MIDVTLEHVGKLFGTVKGVDDVHIQIKPGEFFTFLGPSGCGKTTTLRMIAGFYIPSSGRILFGNREVTGLPPHKRNTGMVFQNYALFPHLTVFENIAFGLQVRKKNRKPKLRKKWNKLKDWFILKDTAAAESISCRGASSSVSL